MWCKHYNGGDGDVCAAGVNKHQLFDEQKGRSFIKQMPCFGKNAAAPECLVCPCVSYPTKEELAATEADHAKASANAQTVANEIDRVRAQFAGTGGFFTCPCCGTGSVEWSVAPNGHRRASCTTAGCVCFIE